MKINKTKQNKKKDYKIIQIATITHHSQAQLAAALAIFMHEI